MAKIITPEILDQIIELAGQGMSQRLIAQQLGITRDQVQHNLAKVAKVSTPQSQVSEPTMSRNEKYEPDTRVRILQQINDDLEIRYKKMKRDLEEMETDFKKIRTERDDLKLELRLFNAEKDLEIKKITSDQKSGLNGLVDKLGDPNVLASLPSIVEAFKMAIGKPPVQGQQLSGSSIPIPTNLSADKASILKYLVDSIVKLDETKFNQLCTIVATVASTNEYDNWLTETYISITSPTPNTATQNQNPSNPK